MTMNKTNNADIIKVAPLQ